MICKRWNDKLHLPGSRWAYGKFFWWRDAHGEPCPPSAPHSDDQSHHCMLVWWEKLVTGWVKAKVDLLTALANPLTWSLVLLSPLPLGSLGRVGVGASGRSKRERKARRRIGGISPCVFSEVNLSRVHWSFRGLIPSRAAVPSDHHVELPVLVVLLLVCYTPWLLPFHFHHCDCERHTFSLRRRRTLTFLLLSQLQCQLHSTAMLILVQLCTIAG